jgi:hypothetical protein
MNVSMILDSHAVFELRFKNLFRPDVRHPCDAKGHGSRLMSERLRDSYFYARTVIGCEVGMPVDSLNRYVANGEEGSETPQQDLIAPPMRQLWGRRRGTDPFRAP